MFVFEDMICIIFSNRTHLQMFFSLRKSLSCERTIPQYCTYYFMMRFLVCLFCFVFFSSFLFSLLLSCSSSSFIRLCLKRGGLAVCTVGGSCVSVLFCSFIGWGCKWKALCSRSPLFLSSCVLTFSLYLCLSLSPCRTTH